METESSEPVKDEPSAETREADVSPSPRRRARSPLLAALLSFVFPGAGQLYQGRRRAAAIFAVPALAAVVWAVLQLSHGMLYFAVSMLDESYALTVMAVVAALTVWRAISIADPIVVARRRRIGTRAGAALALLLIATVAMGDMVFANAYNAYNASRQIASNDFAAWADRSFEPGDWEWYPDVTDRPWWLPSDMPEASPTPGPTCNWGDVPQQIAHAGFQDPAESSAPSPTESESSSAPSPTESESPSPTPEATPSPSPSSSPEGSPHRLTVLLTGVDFIAGRSHSLNDSLMLVSVDLQTRAVAMVSVPRDTAAFPFYWGGQAPVNFRINALANAVRAHHFGSPDPPYVTLANEIGYLVGLKVDYYAVIDMAGFMQMIDLVGGVDINNPNRLYDPFTCTNIPAGPVHLNGSLALKYVRSRESTSDYARAGRQQIVLMALQKKMISPAMLPRLGSLLALAGRSIATNFPLAQAKDYVDTAEHISSISRCVLGPPYNYHPDYSLTNGYWVSWLKLDQVANLSVQLFGTDSRYYGQPGVVPAPCQFRN